MDYKQHKGNLRGQIKNQVERKLYNKRIRAEAIDVDTSEGQLTIPAVISSLREHEECRLCGEPTEQSGDDELCDNCFSRNDL